MSKKNLLLISVPIILGMVYAIYFTDWFNKPAIEIAPRFRMEASSRRGPQEMQVTFNFDSKVKLTEIKVISLGELETNKYPHAAWHLISETNSAPTKSITYGKAVTGMKPKIPKMKGDPLQPSTKYRLFIEAGKRKGQVDFEMPAWHAAR